MVMWVALYKIPENRKIVLDFRFALG
jgi:hypothetical protein